MQHMERIIVSLLLTLSTDFFIASFPIKNGFSVKFKPLSYKEEVHPKTFGALFAKISQEFTPEAILRREIFSKSFSGDPPELGKGCTNQIAKLMFPFKYKDDNYSFVNHDPYWPSENYLNLPIIKQPYKDYKILVATAPPNVKIGKGPNSKRIVVYVIFRDEGNKDSSNKEGIMIPEIYFVKKAHSDDHNANGIKSPLILIDSNRTVTGLNSKNVEKFIKFRNNLLKQYNRDST